MTHVTGPKEKMRPMGRVRKFKLHRRRQRAPRWCRETSPNLGLMVRPYSGTADSGD